MTSFTIFQSTYSVSIKLWKNVDLKHLTWFDERIWISPTRRMKLSKAERESESESEGQKLRCHVCTDFISVDSNGDKLKGATDETTLISPMKKNMRHHLAPAVDLWGLKAILVSPVQTSFGILAGCGRFQLLGGTSKGGQYKKSWRQLKCF